MSINIRVFDRTSGKSKTITVDTEQGALVQEPNGAVDTYLKLTVDARDLAGDTIIAQVVTGDADLVLGTSQYDGSTLSYTCLGTAVDDYVMRMVHGIPGSPDTAMDFNS